MFAVILLLPLFGFTQNINLRYHEYDSVLWEIADHIYNLEHEQAAKALKKAEPQLKSHPIYDFLIALNIVWKTIPELPVEIDSLENHLNQAKLKSELRLVSDKDEPEGILFGLLAHGLLAQYYSLQNQSFKAAGEARKTYSALMKGLEYDNVYNEFLFSSGLYNYYREKYPEVHPVYKTLIWIFKKGDIELGLAQLERAINETTLARIEAVSYLAYIYLRYENSPKDAIRILKPVVENYPSNLYFKTLYLEGLMLQNKLEPGNPLIVDLTESSRDYYKLCGNTFEGSASYNAGYYTQAFNHYTLAIKYGEQFTLVGHGAKSFSHAGLARIHDRRGNIDLAKNEYKMVLDYAMHSFLIEEAKNYIKSH